jgi:hypothetical protein
MVVGLGEGIVNRNNSVVGVRGSDPARRRGTMLARLVLPVLLGAAFGPATPAQAQLPGAAPVSPAPAKTYWNKHVFQLPVIIEDPMRASLSQVQLYFKDHPARPWMLREKASPAQRQFAFKAAQDGEYWFAVVTIDKTGRSNPPDISREGPGVVVVLDTKPPHVEILPHSAVGGVCARLDVRDEHLDTNKTRFEYQTADKLWRPLDPVIGQPGVFCIPQQAMFTGMVKATATDKANNNTVRELNLGAMLLGQAGTSNKHAGLVDNPFERATVPSDPPKNEHPKAPNTLETPKNSLPLSPAESKGPPILPQQTETQVVKNVPSAPRPAHGIVNRQLLNSTHVFLEYQIEQAGASGVGKVEIWITSDQGQSWKRLGEDVDRKSPAEVDLPSEGLFGVSLVVTNGRGFGGTPPSTGDVPDWWIEVDATSPVGELISVRPGHGDESNTLIIAWTARDANFGAEPIDLYYSSSREGPWSVIAKGVKNDGRYRWVVPQEVGAQTYVRLVATDKAGNSCICETGQPVALDDMSRPRARVVNVSHPTTRPTPPSVPQQPVPPQ